MIFSTKTTTSGPRKEALRALVVGASLLAASACDVGHEGDRCNPGLSHDECNGGLACTQPAFCPESYCCPTSGPASNPYCQAGCAGGAASICSAGGGNPTAPACLFASCLANAAIATCTALAEQDGGGPPSDAGTPSITGDAADGGAGD